MKPSKEEEKLMKDVSKYVLENLGKLCLTKCIKDDPASIIKIKQ